MKHNLEKAKQKKKKKLKITRAADVKYNKKNVKWKIMKVKYLVKVEFETSEQEGTKRDAAVLPPQCSNE